jgi:hypothetical protein
MLARETYVQFGSLSASSRTGYMTIALQLQYRRGRDWLIIREKKSPNKLVNSVRSASSAACV